MHNHFALFHLISITPVLKFMQFFLHIILIFLHDENTSCGHPKPVSIFFLHFVPKSQDENIKQTRSRSFGKISPKTNAWKTPAVTFFQPSSSPFNTTCCHILNRQFLAHLTIPALIPTVLTGICRHSNMLWGWSAWNHATWEATRVFNILYTRERYPNAGCSLISLTAI